MYKILENGLQCNGVGTGVGIHLVVCPRLSNQNYCTITTRLTDTWQRSARMGIFGGKVDFQILVNLVSPLIVDYCYAIETSQNEL